MLDLIEKWGTIEDKRKTINKLHNWLEDTLHWDDNFVRARYVLFVGNCGSEYQVDRTFEQNKRWLNDFSDNQDMRTAHLTFIEKRKQEKIDVEIEEGEQWLMAHPNAESVRQKIDSMKRRKLNRHIGGKRDGCIYKMPESLFNAALRRCNYLYS